VSYQDKRLRPFSYVCRMINIESNTNMTETDENENVASSCDLLGPLFEPVEMSLTEEFIEGHFVCAIDEMNHCVRGFQLRLISKDHQITMMRIVGSVATNAWLGLALAVYCAFYAVFASPSQDTLSGI